MESITPNIQCKTKEAVITEALSVSSELTKRVINGFLINPFLIISTMAVILVNNTQMPISDFGIIRTMKKIFRKPKNTTEILFNKEYAPLENQREYATEAKLLII